MKLSTEQRFSILSKICRAQHFAWRDAVREIFPEADATEVVERMWEIVGRQTADSYLKRLDPAEPLASQVAASIVWSSRCMGEDAVLEVSECGNEACVVHRACPWHQWHEERGLNAEDRAGCDRWFQTIVDSINEDQNTTLRFETLESLPDGDGRCVRRMWVD